MSDQPTWPPKSCTYCFYLWGASCGDPAPACLLQHAPVTTPNSLTCQGWYPNLRYLLAWNAAKAANPTAPREPLFGGAQ